MHHMRWVKNVLIVMILVASILPAVNFNAIDSSTNFQYKNNTVVKIKTVEISVPISPQPKAVYKTFTGSVKIRGRYYGYTIKAEVETIAIDIYPSSHTSWGWYRIAVVACLDANDYENAGIIAMEVKITLIDDYVYGGKVDKEIQIFDDSVVLCNLGDPRNSPSSPRGVAQHAIKTTISVLLSGISSSFIISQALWVFTYLWGYLYGEYYDPLARNYFIIPDPSAGLRAWCRLDENHPYPPKHVGIGFEFDYWMSTSSCCWVDHFKLTIAVKFGYSQLSYSGLGWDPIAAVEVSKTTIIDPEYTNVYYHRSGGIPGATPY